MSLLTELDAFYTEHRACGDLDGGDDGSIVWFVCECGASMARRADERSTVDPPRRGVARKNPEEGRV